MGESADIAAVAAMVGEPARASMLIALMSGRALTATELALEADVSPATASSHLSKLTRSQLLVVHKQGRHRYFQIADEFVAELVERLCGVAALDRDSKIAPGPADPALRWARVCYDHLAGELGVRLFDRLIGRGWLALGVDGIGVTDPGAKSLEGLGIDVDEMRRSRRLMCRPCLDWSERRHHLAGSLGAALLSRLFDEGWAKRDPNTRAIRFSRHGEERFAKVFLA